MDVTTLLFNARARDADGFNMLQIKMASRIDAINTQMQRLNNEIRDRRRHERTMSRQWVFSHDLLHTLLAAREIRGYHAKSIVPHVRSSAASRHWQPKSNSDIQSIISNV